MASGDTRQIFRRIIIHSPFNRFLFFEEIKVLHALKLEV